MTKNGNKQTKPKALIVCSESPYPFVVGGYERLIVDYQSYVFADFDVYFLDCRRDSLNQLHHYGRPVGRNGDRERIIEEEDFAFAFFVHSDFDFNGPRLIRPLIERVPSFCFTQYHPNPEIDDSRFRGIVTHCAENPKNNLLEIGGSYDPNIFFKNRKNEEFVICVARIHPVKNQLELVRKYRQRVYNKHGLPLFLVGGSSEPEYYAQVKEFIDGVSVRSTCLPTDPMSSSSWRTSREIARLCNRARLFVMPSREESFSIALIEALACGTTCVVNGSYHGFDEAELRPYVYGNINGASGSIVDLIDEALSKDIRIDGAEWVKRYSLIETQKQLVTFIQQRL